jgi:hypothetical protein
MSAITEDEIIRLAVIVTDFGAAVHVGGAVSVDVRTFDLPTEVVEYIKQQRKQTYSTITLAMEIKP